MARKTSQSSADSSPISWTKEAFLPIKASVVQELDALSKGKNRVARLSIIRRQIKTLSDEIGTESLMRRFVLILCALSHQGNHGGLTGSQVTQLRKLAEGILKLSGVKAHHPKSGFLFGDLYTLISRIYRREGQSLTSGWTGQLGAYLSSGSTSEAGPILLIARGYQCLRRGDISEALEDWRNARTSTLTPDETFRISIGVVQGLRILGRLDDAKAEWVALSALEESNPARQAEIAWESICLACQRTQTLDPMVHAIAKERRFTGIYVLEAKLWAWLPKSRQAMEALPKVGTVLESKNSTISLRTAVAKALIMLEDCYDSDIPFPERLMRVSEILEVAKRQLNIERELLIYGALARWLSRNRAYDFANLVVSEYRALCWRISKGTSVDTLGLLGTLLD